MDPHHTRDDVDILERRGTKTSVSLDHQRSVIEALSEVDRLLLQSSELEPILGIVLPSIATILRCSSVSVFLFDFDSLKHARAHDFYTNGSETRPVRRIEVDVRRVTDLWQQTSCRWVTPDDRGMAPFLTPLVELGAMSFQLCSLHHDQRVTGLLCLWRFRNINLRIAGCALLLLCTALATIYPTTFAISRDWLIHGTWYRVMFFVNTIFLLGGGYWLEKTQTRSARVAALVLRSEERRVGKRSR